jgi:hypothetical protein
MLLLGIHALALVQAVAGTHDAAGVPTVGGPTSIGLHVHGLVHAVAGPHAVAGVSAVVAPAVAGVLAS